MDSFVNLLSTFVRKVRSKESSAEGAGQAPLTDVAIRQINAMVDMKLQEGRWKEAKEIIYRESKRGLKKEDEKNLLQRVNRAWQASDVRHGSRYELHGLPVELDRSGKLTAGGLFQLGTIMRKQKRAGQLEDVEEVFTWAWSCSSSVQQKDILRSIAEELSLSSLIEKCSEAVPAEPLPVAEQPRQEPQ